MCTVIIVLAQFKKHSSLVPIVRLLCSSCFECSNKSLYKEPDFGVHGIVLLKPVSSKIWIIIEISTLFCVLAKQKKQLWLSIQLGSLPLNIHSLISSGIGMATKRTARNDAVWVRVCILHSKLEHVKK